MCNFFSFVTNPDASSDVYYFDWEQRQTERSGADSHSHICAHFGIDEDKCNKWEYNPLLKTLTLDMQNAEKNDRNRVERWLDKVDWKQIVEPLIIKPIVNPLELPKVEQVTEEQIGWLKEWASVRKSVWAPVRDSVWDSVGDSVRAPVWDSVWASVWDSVWASVWDSAWDSAWDSIWAYCSSFFDIPYAVDMSAATKLWEAGLVPSFDGTTWRLHSGKSADVVYEWTPEE
jgi:hypothetical protein